MIYHCQYAITIIIIWNKVNQIFNFDNFVFLVYFSLLKIDPCDVYKQASLKHFVVPTTLGTKRRYRGIVWDGRCQQGLQNPVGRGRGLGVKALAAQ